MKSRSSRDQEDVEKRSLIRGSSRPNQREPGAEPSVEGAGSRQSGSGGSIASDRSAMRQGGLDVNENTWEALDAELGSHSGRKQRRER